VGEHSLARALRGGRLDADAYDEQETHRSALPGGRHTHEQQAVVDQLHEQHPEERASDRAAATKDRRPTENDGGDDVELAADQVLRVGVPPEDHVDHTAGGGEHPDQDVDEQLGPDHAEASASRCLGVPTDRVDPAPEHRVAKQPPHEHRQQDRDQDHQAHRDR